MIKNKKILLIVTGSIACYKACEILRLLRKDGANVQVMMSQSALKFISKTTFAALSGQEVLIDLFPNSSKSGLEHIELANTLDAIIIVPATANILCKVANGIADDIVSTTLSVCDQPTLFAPAMNFRMWENPATINAVDILRNKGNIILDPHEGLLASLHEGNGRLADPRQIILAIHELFNIPLPLKNKKILITAGPAQEPIDSVRFISNYSSGKMGYALAKNAHSMGGLVTLISGPTHLNSPAGIKHISINSAKEMYKAVHSCIKDTDFIFMAAAVADYSSKKISKQKLKRSNQNITIELTPNPDILKSISKKTTAKIIGFALETNNGEKEALRKLNEKKCDYIILNYADEKGAGFNSSTNRVTIYSKNGSVYDIKKGPKDKIAKKIILYILHSLKNKKIKNNSNL